MRKRFEAIAENGKLFKRSTQNRTYTHCVVIHMKGWKSPHDGREWPPYDRAEWAGTRVLAENNARRWRASTNVDDVEILEAREVTAEQSR